MDMTQFLSNKNVHKVFTEGKEIDCSLKQWSPYNLKQIMYEYKSIR